MRSHGPFDDGDEPGDGRGPARPDDLLSLVVPDDARALDREAEALRRERRSAARRARLRRLLGGRPRSRLGTSGPVLLALVLVAVPGVLLTLLRPGLPVRLPDTPLAAPAVPAGQVGGLLPDVTLSTPRGDRPARTLRPEVLVLVPIPCGCDDALRDVVDQALQVTRAVRLVSPGSADPSGRQVAALDSSAVRGLVATAVDRTGQLAVAYDAHGVTMLVVAVDGVVRAAVRDVQPRQPLGPQLAALSPS